MSVLFAIDEATGAKPIKTPPGMTSLLNCSISCCCRLLHRYMYFVARTFKELFSLIHLRSTVAVIR